VPLGEQLMLAELARQVADEVVLVVGLRLGCLNHALLSAQQILRDGFRLAGWIANTLDPDMPALDANLATLDTLMPVPRLGILGFEESELQLDQAGIDRLLLNPAESA
jgi:dethiobiotin synthetase